MILTIDPEIKSYLYSLTDDEFKILEENIIKNGCLHPLDVWIREGERVLWDGHNRYKICQEHGILFEIKEWHFNTLEECLSAVRKRQLGRRNMTPEQMSYQRGLEYESKKKEVGRPIKKSEKVSELDTAKKLSEQFKVTDRTIRNDASFARDVDSLAEAHGPEIRESILRRDAPLTKKDVREIASKPVVEQQEILGTQKDKKPPRLSGILDSMNEYKRHQRRRQQLTNKTGDAEFASSKEAKTVLEYVIDFERGTPDITRALSGGRFSPEGQVFLNRKLQSIIEKLKAISEDISNDRFNSE